MKLPPLLDQKPLTDWPDSALTRWSVLVKKTEQMKSSSGQGDAFENMLAALRKMASTGRFDGLVELLKRRLTARALTWLWLNDELTAMRLLNARMLAVLCDAQQPRLTRITLQQVAQLYFRRFDLLDDLSEGLREQLEQTLLLQLEKIPAPKATSSLIDPLEALKPNSNWLISSSGPKHLVERARESGQELNVMFSALGLQNFDDGRYADLCRAHFYLDTLRELPLGETDPVFDELLKPSVAKAPFEETRRIGHAALAILIDRAGQEISENWQSFIISLAGDPRISRNAANYREWWQLLGEERIEKVRGWLSKEDLRLFLQAVEQFGLDSQNHSLQRMFPARKRFLEGLFKLKLIRSTRLMLGSNAKQSVKRMLGKEVKTTFATLGSGMTDTAVIYLNCGDFCLIEGSHNFRLWVYLAQPSEVLHSYEKTQFEHSDLTLLIPTAYRKTYPELPHEAVTHNGHWQAKVFSFLAEHGISLDVEQLLSPSDYQTQLQRFGLPVVNSKKTLVPRTSDSKASSKPVTQRAQPAPSAIKATPPHQKQPQTRNLFSSDDRLDKLKVAERKLLDYFSNNPGDKARHAANVFGVETRSVNQLLYGPLKDLLIKDDSSGWHLTEDTQRALEALNDKSEVS